MLKDALFKYGWVILITLLALFILITVLKRFNLYEGYSDAATDWADSQQEGGGVVETSSIQIAVSATSG
jgi:hypothetical protein